MGLVTHSKDILSVASSESFFLSFFYPKETHSLHLIMHNQNIGATNYNFSGLLLIYFFWKESNGPHSVEKHSKSRLFHHRSTCFPSAPWSCLFTKYKCKHTARVFSGQRTYFGERFQISRLFPTRARCAFLAGYLILSEESEISSSPTPSLVSALTNFASKKLFALPMRCSPIETVCPHSLKPLITRITTLYLVWLSGCNNAHCSQN